MSSEYRLEKQFAIHTSGTKFYQVFLIVGPAGACAVRHWSKFHPGADLTPRSVGQNEIKRFATQSMARAQYNTWRKNKDKPGEYQNWKVDEIERDDYAGFKEVIKGYFAPAQVEQIMDAISAQGGDETVDSMPHAAVELEIDRGEAWGSW